MGTREHIVAYLTEVSELYDANGMASTQLAAAVGYPGSSVAFAQLLSGMERSGLIEREVRGKRTYRISLGPARAAGTGGAFRASGIPGVAVTGRGSGVPGVSAVSAVSAVSGVSGNGGGLVGFDYDELARRLLVQVVRRLAATEPDGLAPVDGAAAANGADPANVADPANGAAAANGADPADCLALQETVSGLEYELATAWTKHGKLAEENVRLREQLRAAQRSLALAAERVRRLPASSGLDRSEVVLLQRLLTAEDASPEGLEEARSVS